MFPGMFMRKPDKAAALKQLKSHVVMFQAWVVVIQVTPYVLHFLSTEKEELKLELYLLTLPRQRYLPPIVANRDRHCIAEMI
ncbi:mitochondrial import receptor subunit TOM6 homolog [Glycine soja]|uniref:mitochondrial import receptor subunit TOM6 homolog n=1 Tax=Glycine soja TaxID=3848 RepID=UPI00103BE8C1|nr:mitochondrial import receptor subunit TOM6 homolog [Glycine soja]